MKYIFIPVAIGAALFTLVGVGMAIKVVLFPVHTAGNMINTAYDAQDKVINADNAIYNYEWFKQKKADIDAANKQYQNSADQLASFESSSGPRSSWTFEDKGEDARLRAVVLGQKNYIEGLIGDYNARSSMATRNIFQNSVLPNYIDALTFLRQ